MFRTSFMVLFKTEAVVEVKFERIIMYSDVLNRHINFHFDMSVSKASIALQYMFCNFLLALKMGVWAKCCRGCLNSKLRIKSQMYIQCCNVTFPYSNQILNCSVHFHLS